jgi:hypothetical protein
MSTDYERIDPSFGDGPIQPPSRESVHRHSSEGKAAKNGALSGTKVPLSRAPGRKKLMVGVPMGIVCGVAYLIGNWPLAQMFFVAFLAYALVGLVEVILGASLVRAGEAWAALRWWQRGLASVAAQVRPAASRPVHPCAGYLQR